MATAMTKKQTAEQNIFVRIDQRILNAISKVKAKLKSYSEEAAKIKGNWTEADQERFSDWNHIHDLEYRLDCRLEENCSNWHAWHFETFGWTTY